MKFSCEGKDLLTEILGVLNITSKQMVVLKREKIRG